MSCSVCLEAGAVWSGVCCSPNFTGGYCVDCWCERVHLEDVPCLVCGELMQGYEDAVRFFSALETPEARASLANLRHKLSVDNNSNIAQALTRRHTAQREPGTSLVERVPTPCCQRFGVKPVTFTLAHCAAVACQLCPKHYSLLGNFVGNTEQVHEFVYNLPLDKVVGHYLTPLGVGAVARHLALQFAVVARDREEITNLLETMREDYRAQEHPHSLFAMTGVQDVLDDLQAVIESARHMTTGGQSLSCSPWDLLVARALPPGTLQAGRIEFGTAQKQAFFDNAVDLDAYLQVLEQTHGQLQRHRVLDSILSLLIWATGSNIRPVNAKQILNLMKQCLKPSPREAVPLDPVPLEPVPLEPSEFRILERIQWYLRVRYPSSILRTMAACEIPSGTSPKIVAEIANSGFPLPPKKEYPVLITQEPDPNLVVHWLRGDVGAQRVHPRTWVRYMVSYLRETRNHGLVNLIDIAELGKLSHQEFIEVVYTAQEECSNCNQLAWFRSWANRIRWEDRMARFLENERRILQTGDIEADATPVSVHLASACLAAIGPTTRDLERNTTTTINLLADFQTEEHTLVQQSRHLRRLYKTSKTGPQTPSSGTLQNTIRDRFQTIREIHLQTETCETGDKKRCRK